MSKKRVALITGGGKGVGAGIARVFAANGISVCMGYHSSEELSQKNLNGILEAGGDAFLYRADVSDREQVHAMVEQTVSRYGGIDILVNNAALQPNKYIREYDAELFTKLWQINIGGYYRVTQESLPYLKVSDCPRIINISSVHGKRPAVFDAGYSMTKAAIRMFTRETALELAKYGITVNTVDLGACRIEGKTGGKDFPFRVHRAREATVNPMQPFGRVPYPEDVGHLALYLISEEARNMTGDGIRLDGGLLLV